MTATNKICGNCSFSHREEDSSVLLDCRRYPPHFAANETQETEAISAIGKSGMWRGWWVQVFPSDWCGEWQAVEPEQDQ